MVKEKQEIEEEEQEVDEEEQDVEEEVVRHCVIC